MPLFTTIRRRISTILNASQAGGKNNRWFDYGLIFLIILNVIAVVASSVESFNQHHERALYYFEVFSVTVFTLEYLARLWSCIDIPENQTHRASVVRLRYIFSPIALIDLISIVPFYLVYFTSIDLRILRIFRILRVFKLTRYSGALHTLLSVIVQEASALTAALMLMMLVLLLSASGIYAIEQDVQPEHFGSIPQAMWWAVATLTTVGYGDVVPMTPLGKIFGGMVIFLGVAMVALPTGIIASGFADAIRNSRLRYETMLRTALEDGILSEEERQQLRINCEELDISAEEAELIYEAALGRRKMDRAQMCPHCGHPSSR